jgi:hypothetical protein
MDGVMADKQDKPKGPARQLYKKALDAFRPAEPAAKEFGDDFLKEAMERADEGYNRERENIDAGYEDLEFEAGNQWPDWARKQREAEDRPVLTLNKIPEFKRQVTGDMRLMRPGLKVSPAGSGAKQAVADLLAGMIRHIESRSEAKTAYAIASDQQVGAGMGHWRVAIDYAPNQGLNKELRIVHIEDGLAVLWDPDAVLPTREDALWCIVPVDISTAKFKRKYPDVEPADFKSFDRRFHGYWFDSDRVRVGEYWFKKPAKRTYAVMSNGTVDDVTDWDKAKIEAEKSAGNIKRTEEREGFKVYRSVITIGHVLEEPEEWKGNYIPIVPLVGEEIRIGRRIVRRGIIRNAKDGQRLYNISRSSQAEVINDAPKSPWVGTDKNFREFEGEWAEANRKRWPYLRYTPDPLNSGQAPQRSSPAIVSAALSEAVQLADQDMMALTGIHQAGLGQRSNETSGKAILARQREGDVGTVVYSDNLGLSIRHTGAILLDLMPHVYDTEREVPVRHADGKTEMVTINKAVYGGELEPTEESDYLDEGAEPTEDSSGLDMADKGTEEKEPIDQQAGNALNDVTLGCYIVDLDMGPSYSTARAEAKDGMEALMQAAPAVAPLILDLYARAQDWPEANDIADRILATLPPAIQAQIAAKKRKALGEIQPEEAPQPGQPGQAPGAVPGQPPAPPLPTPEQLQAIVEQQVAQRADVVKEQAAKEIAALNVRQKELDVERAKIALAEKQAETAAHQAQAAGMPDTAAAFKQLATELAHQRGMIEEIVSQLPHPETVDGDPTNDGGAPQNLPAAPPA